MVFLTLDFKVKKHGIILMKSLNFSTIQFKKKMKHDFIEKY